MSSLFLFFVTYKNKIDILKFALYFPTRIFNIKMHCFADCSLFSVKIEISA